MKEHKDIFVSYRRGDGAEFAEGISKVLENQGYRVFFDKKMPKGASFPKELEEAVRNCKEFIAVVTKQYFGKDNKGNRRIDDKNDWVRNECRIAIENNVSIFPILVCHPPKANTLPADIAAVTTKQYTVYNRQFDTFDDIVNRIKVCFCDITKENALVGVIKSRIEEIDVRDNQKFNVACKDIIKLIASEKDTLVLMNILSKKDSTGSGKERSNERDIRFVVYYTLLTYYRRMNMSKNIISMVEKYGEDFSEFAFNNYAMNEYYLEKAKISLTTEEATDSLVKAISYAKLAIERIENNNGIMHSFPYSVAMALDYGVEVNDNDISMAMDYVETIIKRAPDYGGMYYSTKARLLCHRGYYEEALRYIRIAQAMEMPIHKDWILRISTYQKQELYISIRMELNELKKNGLADNR